MSSRLDRETGEVVITTNTLAWCEKGHRLAVKGSPAEYQLGLPRQVSSVYYGDELDWLGDCPLPAQTHENALVEEGGLEAPKSSDLQGETAAPATSRH